MIEGFKTQLDGKGPQAAAATEYFNPLLSSARRLVNETTEDEGALTRFIVSSSRTVTAIAERRDDLADARRQRERHDRRDRGREPRAERGAGAAADDAAARQQTFVNLRATLDDLDPLVADSKPATKDLAPFLRELRPLVRDAKPTIADLSHARAPARRRQRPRRGDAQAARLPEGRQPGVQATAPAR